MDTIEWRALSTYESADILIRLYKHLHKGATLSKERASEIAAWFSQGREYFAASQASGPLVRPVLQYYGALGLARGTILLLHGGSNHGLSEAHGLTPKGWTTLLRDPKRRTAVSFIVGAKGTFISLAETTRNRDMFSYVKQSSLESVRDQTFPVDVLREASFSFEDTLARIADLGPVYQRCTENFPSALPASLSEAEFNGMSLSVNTGIPITHDVLKETYGLSDAWRPIGRMLESETYLMVDGSALANHLPHIEEHEDGDTAIVAPYPNGIRLSRLLRIHLLSAFLGTYARYHPEPWIAAVFGHVSGDHLMPLIRAATNLVDTEYPRLIIKELEDRV